MRVQKGKGYQRIISIKTFVYEKTRRNTATIQEKRKTKCQTDHIYQEHFHIKLPVILILQLNQ